MSAHLVLFRVTCSRCHTGITLAATGDLVEDVAAKWHADHPCIDGDGKTPLRKAVEAGLVAAQTQVSDEFQAPGAASGVPTSGGKSWPARTVGHGAEPSAHREPGEG